MENSQDQVVKLFKDGLQGHEMLVSEGVWTGVQSSLAAQSAAVAVGSKGLIKAAAVAGIISVAVIGVFNEVKLANQEVNSIEFISDQVDESNFNSDTEVTQADEWSDANQTQNQTEQLYDNDIETVADQSELVVSNPGLESEIGDGLAQEISKDN